MISPIQYICAENIEAALAALQNSRHVNRLLAGGTDLIIELRKRQEQQPVCLIDISRISELQAISQNRNGIQIGAAVTHALLITNPLIRQWAPLLAEAAATIGSVQIRNRGTIGGNICNASPCADTAPVLLVLEAQVEIQSRQESRLIPLADFLTAPYRTILQPEEMAIKFHLAALPENSGSAFIKLGRRATMTIARMNVAVVLQGNAQNKLSDVRIAVGSVMPTAARVAAAEKLLRDQKPSVELFQAAGAKVAQEMVRVTGCRWSTPYKEPVIAVLVQRALSLAWKRARRQE